MENSEKIKRTAQDYAGTLEDLKNSKNDYGNHLIIRGRYKAALGKIILNEFLEGRNERPMEFTEGDIIRAINQAGGRDFEDYEYDGHRRDPNGYFVKEILEACLRHHMFIHRCNGVYRRNISEALMDKKQE